MEITNPEHLTGAMVLALRREQGIKQSRFWNAIGVHTSTGSGYENEHFAIPNPVRRLIFMHYVAGIPTDAAPEELMRIGGLIAGSKSAYLGIQGLRKNLDGVARSLARAEESAHQITHGKEE